MAGRRLGRSSGHRRALYRNLVTDLLRHEHVTTTEAKAKAIRPLAERLITLAKRGLADERPERTLHARRLAVARLNDPLIARKLFEVLAPRYQDRPGGYTRIIKLNQRLGDAAKMARIELVEE
ncbi:MAG: 50S ribosomal protein L17 [Chloroflexi bacterium]|nr:50S ribosomal protein L17 [Chloroflexota bacterium]MBU1750891.1 50S ribosomal protein L17 [Chloroflexota bacterium]MBU1879476.1 50S ribosomal protein L17 [Chloroflexota bacterium]